MSKRRIITSLAVLAVAALALFFVWQPLMRVFECYAMGRSFDDWDTFGKRIEEADSAEILILGRAREGEPVDMEGYERYRAKFKTRITGNDLLGISKIWFSLIYSPRSTKLCHGPPYGVRYFKAGKLIGEATFCWHCSNIFLKSRGIEGLYGFDSAEGKWMFDNLQKLAPLPEDPKKGS